MTTLRKVPILGCDVDALTLDEAVIFVGDAMKRQRRLTHTSLNTAKLVSMRANDTLRRSVQDSDLVTADGMGIVLAARLLNQPLPERLTGIDLMQGLLALCAQEGFRPYFLGARRDVLDRAVENLSRQHPDLHIAGSRHGYFAAAEESAIVRQINQSGADCLFVGLPTPMKERFLADHRHRLQPAFTMGVGGSFDVVARVTRRAPVWMQNHGLEWVYRTWQEPRRMWWRYLSTNILFLGMLATALVRRAIGLNETPVQGDTGGGVS